MIQSIRARFAVSSSCSADSMDAVFRRGARLFVGVVLAALTVAACSSDGGGKDDSALLGCRNFQGVANDYSDGALSNSELRARLQEVRDDSEFAPASVSEAANAMVRATDPFDEPALVAAVNAMQAACERAGY